GAALARPAGVGPALRSRRARAHHAAIADPQRPERADADPARVRGRVAGARPRPDVLPGAAPLRGAVGLRGLPAHRPRHPGAQAAGGQHEPEPRLDGLLGAGQDRSGARPALAADRGRTGDEQPAMKARVLLLAVVAAAPAAA